MKCYYGFNISYKKKINGFPATKIKPILSELSKHCINGKVIRRFKEKPKYIQQLKSQMSHANQAFGIWMAIESLIDGIGPSPRNNDK